MAEASQISQPTTCRSCPTTPRQPATRFHSDTKGSPDESALGMLLDFRKARKYTCLQLVLHPSCMDPARGTIWYIYFIITFVSDFPEPEIPTFSRNFRENI